MSTVNLTRGTATWIQGASNQVYNNASGNNAGKWTWYIGRRWFGYSNDWDAAAIAYTVPSISDALISRTVTIPATFIHSVGNGTARAVLSTQAPSGVDSLKHGPTSGIVSNEITFSYTDTSLSFTVFDGVGLSGKTLYLYLYAPDSQATGNAVFTQSFGETASLTYYAPYTLTVSAGEGSTVTVNRLSSGAGATGVLSSGATLYHGDVLQISFGASSNYQLLTATVNGSAFTSGNTLTVTGDVSIAATAQALSSTIGATDANIGSVSTITINRKSAAYTHSVMFTFGSLSGYVTEDGGVSGSEVKLSGTQIAFVVPASFYSQIPNATRGECTLTCRTYNGDSQIGETKYATFIAVAAEYACKPSVSGTVVDSNDVTKALTHDASALIRYFSTAFCTISAAAKNSASLSQKSIGGVVVSGDTRSIPGIEADNIVFAAVDSRGYASSYTAKFTLIPYVRLTNNSVALRDDPTSGKATLTIRGDFYNASFGASGESNTLQVKYRVNGGSLITVTPAVSGNTYTASIPLSDLDYQSEHTVEVYVSDALDDVPKTIPIKRGIPVFDWGKEDFRVNLAMRLREGGAYGTALPGTAKEGQLFLLISGNSITVKLYTGGKWI